MGFAPTQPTSTNQQRYEFNTDPEAVATPAMIFVLVHGTYVPKTRWTQPGSEFRENLRRASVACGPINFYEFVWRGALNSRFNNSHRLRLNAGQQLRRHLRQIVHQNPGIPIFMVGHSHGGNVVHYALRDSKLRRHIAGIATLATTHMVFQPRKASSILIPVYLLTLLYLLTIWSGVVFLLNNSQPSAIPGLAVVTVALATLLSTLPTALNRKYKITHRFRIVVAQLHRRFSYISTPSIKEVPHFWGCARWAGASEKLNMESMLTALPRFGLNQWLFNMQVTCFCLGLAAGLNFWGWLGLLVGLPLGVLFGVLFSNLLVVITLPLYVARTVTQTPIAMTEGDLFHGGESVLFHSVGKILIRKVRDVGPSHALDELKEYQVDATFEHNIYDKPEVQRDLSHWVNKIWHDHSQKS